MKSKTAYTNVEVFNLDGQEGGKVHKSYDISTHNVPDGSKTLMGDVGLLTYSRAEELFGLRRKDLSYKLLCGETRLSYRLGKDTYEVRYRGEMLLRIVRTGWYIYAPYNLWILYPGYSNRIRNFTTCKVFKPNRDYRLCCGSLTRSFDRHTHPDGFFVDYSEILKCNHYYLGRPRRTVNTPINSRMQSWQGWWSTEQLRGRIYSTVGSQVRRLTFLKSIIRGFVSKYLEAHHCMGYNRPTFSDFCSQPSLSYTSDLGDDNIDDLPVGRKLGFSYLNDSPELYSIDYLRAVCPPVVGNPELEDKTVVSCFHEKDGEVGDKLLKIVNEHKPTRKYGMLVQAMFALRGLKFVPSYTQVNAIQNLLLTDKDTKRAKALEYVITPSSVIDKYKISGVELGINRSGYGHQSRGEHSYHMRQLDHETRTQLCTRKYFLTLFFKYMSWMSDGGHQKIVDYDVEAVRRMLSNQPQRHNGSDRLLDSLGYTSDIMISCGAPQEGSTSKKRVVHRFGTHSDYSYNSLLERTAQHCGGLTDLYVMYKEMKNPLPRMLFFLMFDEYCNNSLLDKQSLVKLVASEWERFGENNGTGSGDVETGLPLSWDIMHSFLSKRISGIFTPVLQDDPTNRMYCMDALRSYGLFPERNTNNYYRRGSDVDSELFPPESLGEQFGGLTDISYHMDS